MQTDILILGGGPSGLSTALHLAQSALQLLPRILLLEEAHYPLALPYDNRNKIVFQDSL